MNYLSHTHTCTDRWPVAHDRGRSSLLQVRHCTARNTTDSIRLANRNGNSALNFGLLLLVYSLRARDNSTNTLLLLLIKSGNVFDSSEISREMTRSGKRVDLW